ncbi:MAG: circularly permuted type 2 ATP-grasp protein, partial [Bacteroidia bacterium]|nr:circularly permuted type 2 ATP-grasp protein [Bacteroidia bacterium]
GVPGLVQAVRKGNIAIANPLGSSIVENAGLVPFLPAVAKHFFGTDLIMPTIATWWCGQPKEMQYVIANFKTLVVRKIFRNIAGTRSAIDGASLSETQANELVQQIKANPFLYVGQEKINLSSAPSWLDGKIVAGHSLFRSFLVSNNNSYVAMPGGLTRTKIGINSFIISNQMGGTSKDTWVLSSNAEQEQPVNLQLNTDVLQNKVQKRSLPSHTAENLFWVGRYTERVINNARLQRTVMQQILKSNKTFSEYNSGTEGILLQSLTKCTYTFPGFIENNDPEKRTNPYAKTWEEMRDVLFNEKRNGSLSHNISLLIHAVYGVRNFWATDTWRVLRQIEDEWNKEKSETHTDHFRMINSIDTLNASMFAFLGMNRESVRREQGWNIMDLGRKIEQSLYVIILLKNIFQKKQKDQVEHELLESVMIASQSLITYRYTYRDHLQLPLVLELLMLDNNYPKSLAYLVKKIKRYVALLHNGGNDSPLSNKQRNIREADSLLKLADVIALTQYDPYTKDYVALNNFLDKLYSLIADTSVLISKKYFKHSQIQKQLFTANFI